MKIERNFKMSKKILNKILIANSKVINNIKQLFKIEGNLEITIEDMIEMMVIKKEEKEKDSIIQKDPLINNKYILLYNFKRNDYGRRPQP